MEAEKTRFQEELARTLARAIVAETELWKTASVRPGLLHCRICRGTDSFVPCRDCKRPHCVEHGYERLCPDCHPEHTVVSWSLCLQRSRDRRVLAAERSKSATSRPASP